MVTARKRWTSSPRLLPSRCSRHGAAPSRVNVPRMTIRSGHPDFLDLDWTRPLASWPQERLLSLLTGRRGGGHHPLRGLLLLAVERQADVGNDEAFAHWLESGRPGYPLGDSRV